MSDAELQETDLDTGFSTPPSSSVDTCDSGFTDLYSNNFTLIKSAHSNIVQSKLSKVGHSMATTPSPSPSPASIRSCDAEKRSDLSKSSESSDLDTFELSDKVNFDADDRPRIGSSDNSQSTSEKQRSSASSSTCKESDKSNEFDEHKVDDFNDDSASDISDLSDVFKLNSDILPEMQRSINWVSITSRSNPSRLIKCGSSHLRRHFELNRFTCKSRPA